MANEKAMMAFFTVAILAVAAVCVVVVQNNNQVETADDTLEPYETADDTLEPYNLGVFETYDEMWGTAHEKENEILFLAKAEVTNDSDSTRNGMWTIYKYMTSLVFCHQTSVDDSMPDELTNADETGNAKDLKVVDETQAKSESSSTDSGKMQSSPAGSDATVVTEETDFCPTDENAMSADVDSASPDDCDC